MHLGSSKVRESVMPQRECLDSTEFDYAKTKSILEFFRIYYNLSQGVVIL